jgi:hypothetical protein
MNVKDYKSRVAELSSYPAKRFHMQFAFTPKKEIKMKQFRIHFLGVIARLLNARKCRLWATAAGLAFVFVSTLIVPFTVRQTAHAQVSDSKVFVAPVVFQAAGKDAASIQSSVDAFRAALGNPNNGNAGPLNTGHREINWDGAGGVDTTTTVPVTPFNVFLNTRGSQFTTPGIGLTQAPASGGPQGGLAVLFNNPTYGTIFKPFSNMRLFTPVGSNITEALFFRPGSNGTVPATVSGFGAVFTDVDQPDGSGPGEKRGNRGASTLMEFFGVNGELLFSSFVPASPGDGSQSFFGINFNDARIARVRITTGDVAPGPDDDSNNDIVVMDDFIYGEPKALP